MSIGVPILAHNPQLTISNKNVDMVSGHYSTKQEAMKLLVQTWVEKMV